jgi:hypothetical protein
MAFHQALPDADVQVACLPNVEPLVTCMIGPLDVVDARPSVRDRYPGTA